MNKICKVEGCNKEILWKGFCNKHYWQIWRNGKLKDKEIILDLEGEIWENIEGYEGLYQVSNLGRVKSLAKTVKCGRGEIILEEKLLKFRNNHGYNRVHLMKNKKEKNFFVHRLVALAFIPNPNNYPIINHIDENRSNNNVNNLEWCTQKHNVNHGTAIKRMSNTRKGHEVKQETRDKISKELKGIKRDNIKGSKHYYSKRIQCITTGEIFECMQDAIDKYKINNISACCRGVQRYAGIVNGKEMIWQYVQ